MDPQHHVLQHGHGGKKPDVLGDFILKLKEMGYTVVLIEHDMKLVMSICEHIYVQDHGECIAYGTPEEVKSLGRDRDPLLNDLMGRKGRNVLALKPNLAGGRFWPWPGPSWGSPSY